MILWARLTWQTAEPAGLSRDLGRRLGVEVREGGMAQGARLLDLGNAVLEVRPWVREGPGDAPRRTGRLLLEAVPSGEAAPVPAAGSPWTLLGLGWATVELDRAAEELGPWVGSRAAGGPWTDAHLGATAAVFAGGGLPGAWTVLLEPSTEGRTAAALARDGEGPCALYLRPAAGLDAWAGEGRELLEGPFGRQVLLPDASRGPATGPFVIVTEGRDPAGDPGAPGTIPA